MYLKKIFCLTIHIFVLINAVCSVSLPTICKLNDSECITKTAQAFVPIFAQGIPDIGLETMEPLQIKKVNASLGTLKFILTDLKFTGFKDTVIKRIRFDQSKSVLALKIQVTVNLEAKYAMSGNLLFLPIEGQGPLHARIRKLEIVIDDQMKEVTLADGKTHWNAVDIFHSFKLMDKSEVIFENLFEGNPLLATAAKEMISANGNEIILEIGSPVVKSVIDEIILRKNILYQAIPLDELYLK